MTKEQILLVQIESDIKQDTEIDLATNLSGCYSQMIEDETDLIERIESKFNKIKK